MADLTIRNYAMLCYVLGWASEEEAGRTPSMWAEKPLEKFLSGLLPTLMSYLGLRAPMNREVGLGRPPSFHASPQAPSINITQTPGFVKLHR
jgi:hypothetical protein